MADEKEISNAFGNDIEDTKNEKTVDQTENQVKDETKGNSDDVKDESKNDDPSIDSKNEGADTKGENKDGKEKMYTQAQVDAMMARARKKYTKGSEQVAENDVPGEEKQASIEDGALVDGEENPNKEDTKEEPRDLSTGITVDKLARAELKAQMAIDGVNPSKLVYACRMINVADVTDESGNYSEEMAKTAIEELLKVMPELKVTQQQTQNQFSFGAPEQQEQNPLQEEKDKISEIFGNI